MIERPGQVFGGDGSGQAIEYSPVPGDDAPRPRDRAVQVILERAVTFVCWSLVV